jgi:hypothetical protein
MFLIKQHFSTKKGETTRECQTLLSNVNPTTKCFNRLKNFFLICFIFTTHHCSIPKIC